MPQRTLTGGGYEPLGCPIVDVVEPVTEGAGVELDSPGVDVDACGRFEDHPGLLGVDAVGAGVVDEEAEAVGVSQT